MTINYQLGHVAAHRAIIRARAATLEAKHQAIVQVERGDAGRYGLPQSTGIEK